ncbi:Centrosomal protein of 97 kDa [Taenia solium]|eukprot:TsM_000846100 transcript=TsM_000846100 gene=TsM_000846100
MSMCPSIINLSEQGLETLDYSYENATAIILDKNDIRDINTLSFIANVQQLSIANNLLKGMYGLENLTNLTILNLAYNEIARIECLSSLAHLTWLNLCGNRINTLLLHCNRIASLKMAEEFLPQSLCILSLAENDIPTLTEPLQDERLLGEWIAGSAAVHRFESEGESALIDFLRSLNPDLPYHVEPLFRRQSDTTRCVACSRAPVLKRGFTVANDATPPISRRSTPPRWLQRARSAQNITSTAAVAASTCLADLANSDGNLEPSFRCQPQISIASCSAILAPTNPCVPHLLRSDSVFIPIDSETELEEAEAEARVQSPKNVSQTVSVDLPDDWHPHSASGPTRKPSSVPDIENDRDGDTSLVHRLQFSRGALASLLQHRSYINEGPAINMMSEKAEHPPFEPGRSPEGLEAKVLALRRQLEELRVLSVNQERERLRQASDIRHLAEEVGPFCSNIELIKNFVFHFLLLFL